MLPLHRVLAVWGLTGDGIGVLTIHGTSSGANISGTSSIWYGLFTNVSLQEKMENETQIWTDIFASHKYSKLTCF
jgi:hypothetical protein